MRISKTLSIRLTLVLVDNINKNIIFSETGAMLSALKVLFSFLTNAKMLAFLKPTGNVSCVDNSTFQSSKT